MFTGNRGGWSSDPEAAENREMAEAVDQDRYDLGRAEVQVSTGTVYRPQSREELRKLANDPSVSLGDIDTSRITDMHELFSHSDRKDFQGIGDWDTSRVTDMSGMFDLA